MQAEQPSLAFFSSVTEHEFARLQAASIKPATHRHGPFFLPAPGFSVDTPVLHLLDLRCAPEDWSKVLEALTGWQNLPSTRPPHLALPDGRLYAFASEPRARQGMLAGLVRAVTADAKPGPLLALRLAHDGASTLELKLNPLPEHPALLPETTSPTDTPAP